MLKVIDMLPGSGKTTQMCKWLGKLVKSKSQLHFIYLTPYNKEADKIGNSILFHSLTPFQQMAYKTGEYTANDFRISSPQIPDAVYTKGSATMKLLRKGENVTCSHELFRLLVRHKKFWKLIDGKHYILVIDEELALKSDYHFRGCSLDDMKIFLMRSLDNMPPFVSVDENDVLHWDCTEKKAGSGVFKQLKRDIKTDSLCFDKEQVKWRIPIEKFDLFDDVYLMTYRFEFGTFCQVWNREWEYWHFDNGNLVPGKWKMPGELAKRIKRRLVVADRGYPAVGKVGHYSYSLAWYKEATDEDFAKIINKIVNWQKYGAAKKRLNRNRMIWTTFKDQKERIEKLDTERDSFRPKKNDDTFIPLNMRASNDYLDRNMVVYLVDRYMGSPFSRDGEEWALSELLQLLFRTVLRLPESEEPVYVWVPSDRMRQLLVGWLDSLGN